MIQDRQFYFVYLFLEDVESSFVAPSCTVVSQQPLDPLGSWRRARGKVVGESTKSNVAVGSQSCSPGPSDPGSFFASTLSNVGTPSNTLKRSNSMQSCDSVSVVSATSAVTIGSSSSTSSSLFDLSAVALFSAARKKRRLHA